MKIFLSWSGPKSKAVAETLKNWIPQIIQAAEPWISVDIDKGRRWSSEISGQLEESRVGIVCLTRDNLESPWINFEAGALSKTKDAFVCTLLLDIKPADVEPPLGTFQHTTISREDVFKLVNTIKVAVEAEDEVVPSDTVLNNLFDKLWPDLNEKLEEVAALPTAQESVHRSDREILEEILQVVRAQDIRREQSVSSSTSEMLLPAVLPESVWKYVLGVIKEQSSLENADLFNEKPEKQPTDTIAGFPRKRGVRIHNLSELQELWPNVLARIKRKIGVSAVAYLHSAIPVDMNDEIVTLEFDKAFHYEKAVEAANRLPFEKVLNECLATPHKLELRLAKDE